MSFQDTLRKNLTPELYESVVDQLGDDFDWDMVPRSRLNKVIKQRNELRNQLAGGTHSEPSDDDSPADPAPVGPSAAELEKQYKEQSEKAIKAVKLQYAALEKLRSAGIIDPDLVWSSNAINKDGLDLDDSGSVTGLEDIITQLKKSKAHLFKSADDGVPKGTGKEGGEPFKTVTTREEFLKLDSDKQYEFKRAHPEAFKSFMNAN